MLFRWFVGLNADEAVWDVTVYTKNRERLLEASVAAEFFAQMRRLLLLNVAVLVAILFGLGGIAFLIRRRV